jgi:hypothetical protein
MGFLSAKIITVSLCPRKGWFGSGMGRYKMKKTVCVFECLLMLMGSSAVAVSSANVLLSDDAYHYRYFRDGEHDANYIEWWYFNLVAKEIQVVFHYSIMNPDDYLHRGMAGVGVIAYTPDGIVEETDWFSPDLFFASYEKADVIIPCADPLSSFIEVNDDGTYHIVGHIGEDCRVSWDLTYEPHLDPWFARKREKVGLFPWEMMSWLVYMPGALVCGSIVIDGRTYSVNNVPGYHDHNWGEWIPTNALWNWAQYFEPELKLAFGMGDFRFKTVGVVSISFDGGRTVFEEDEYFLLHTRWTYDWENQKWFPESTWLCAENETMRLIVRLQTLDAKAVLAPLKTPSFLPEVLIYEQTAGFLGRLWKKNEAGQWQSLVSFGGKGFKEYTALKWGH